MKKQTALATLLLISVFSLLVIAACAKQSATNAQIPNPSAKLCEDNGYKYEIVNNPDGSQAGNCIINGITCDGWAYYRGECPTCDDYCKKQPHIQCVGTWNNSGTYPDCKCGFVCTPGEVTY